MKPQPPCGRHCPKRCAVPNCHDPAICGDWAAYQDAIAEFNRTVKTGRRSMQDVDIVRKGPGRALRKKRGSDQKT